MTYRQLVEELQAKQATLVAVSKTKTVKEIQQLYDLGQRHFGENYVQELVEKEKQLPEDICWHFIGHLQTNKVKQIAPFIHLVHSVDSIRLLKEINKNADKNKRVIDCLFQVYIAQEETKFGLDQDELDAAMKEIKNLNLANVRVAGLMGMASFTEDMEKVREEFKKLRSLFNKFRPAHSGFSILSMGMTADYKIAVEEGSNMVRIGSLIFGVRNHDVTVEQ